MCLRVEGLDTRDGTGSFRGGSCAQVHMGTMLCEAGDGVVAAVILSILRKIKMKGEETDMPEFPPVTMYTLPLRSGRELGWKVILEMKIEIKKR